MSTLRSRIGSNHLSGNAGSSTFRKTLSSVLMAPLQLHLSGKDRLDQISNRSVSMWMRRHLAIVTVQVEERSTLAEIEEAVLARLDPPLNLMGMAVTPIRAYLRELRREFERQPRLSPVAGRWDGHRARVAQMTPHRRLGPLQTSEVWGTETSGVGGTDHAEEADDHAHQPKLTTRWLDARRGRRSLFPRVPPVSPNAPRALGVTARPKSGRGHRTWLAGCAP